MTTVGIVGDRDEEGWELKKSWWGDVSVAEIWVKEDRVLFKGYNKFGSRKVLVYTRYSEKKWHEINK